jgi:hypothetical protein
LCWKRIKNKKKRENKMEIEQIKKEKADIRLIEEISEAFDTCLIDRLQIKRETDRKIIIEISFIAQKEHAIFTFNLIKNNIVGNLNLAGSPIYFKNKKGEMKKAIKKLIVQYAENRKKEWISYLKQSTEDEN